MMIIRREKAGGWIRKLSAMTTTVALVAPLAILKASSVHGRPRCSRYKPDDGPGEDHPCGESQRVGDEGLEGRKKRLIHRAEDLDIVTQRISQTEGDKDQHKIQGRHEPPQGLGMIAYHNETFPSALL